MAKNVYYNGKLIPVKDWDYETKRPKVKEVKKKEPVEVEVELLPEVQPSLED
jgi:hypothetical protein